MTIFQNARVYWEMFGGVEPEGQSALYIRALNIKMDVGGWAADDYAYFQVSIYGRKNVDGANLTFAGKSYLYRHDIHRPTGSNMWTPLHIAVNNSGDGANHDFRCIVVKVELVEQTFIAPDGSEHPMNYSDQYMDADAPPWGIRIHEAHVYGSELKRDLRPHKVFGDILDNAGFSYSGPTAEWTLNQLSFSDIPKDRQDGLDDVNAMLGWNYACWDGHTVEFDRPGAGTTYNVSAADPRTTWSVEESLDETYNAVRVSYGNKAGKPREVIVHGSTAAIGFVRSDTLQAPESIKSQAAATRFGNRYLRAHEKKQVAGSVTITGHSDTLQPHDPLLVRPGDSIRMIGPAKIASGEHEVQRVTLRPLEWTADIEFGSNSKRFDIWMARLAAGAKSIKRR